jgi:spore coat protein H
MDALTPDATAAMTRRRFLAAVAASAAAAAAIPPARFATAADPDPKREADPKREGDDKREGDLKPAAERKAYFESRTIPLIEVEIGKAELNALRKDRRGYVRATVREDGGTTYENVAVRIKGSAGSVRDVGDKPALTLNMDKFGDDQRYHGMGKWHLNNSVQDPSYSTDLFCSDLYRAAGVPTTLTGHATVTLNGRPQGFYVVKEGFDRPFLKTHFGGADGNLYDGGFLQDVDQALRLDGAKPDVPVDRADLKAIVAAAREQDKSKRLDKLDQVLHLDRFITFLALEVFCWDWDGYPMQRNNYRVYVERSSKKATFLPSGMDQMFADPNGPIFPNFNGVVARKLVDAPDGRKRYLATLRKLWDGPLRPDPLITQLDELQERIRPALKKVDVGAAGGLRGQIDRVRNGIRQRAKSVDEQLKREKA